MPSVLNAGGVQLPLEQAADGPMVSTRADPDVEPLAWVLNAAVTGMLPGLREAMAAGEDEVVQGLFAARPDPLENHEAAAAAWRRLSGREPGDDAYVVGTTFSDRSVLVPRAALLELLDALERLRSGEDGGVPHGELDELERRAAELDGAADPAAESAKRRFLLLALDQAGVLGERPPAGVGERPLVAGYRDAAAELRRYLASEERRSLVAEPPPPGVLGARVSLDWFRHPSPRPNPLERPFHWLASGEAALRAAQLDERSGAGEVFVRRGPDWWIFDWRRDDGVTPALVRGAPRGTFRFVIVDCAVYEEGCRRAGELPLSAVGDACRRDGAFVWLGMVEPTEEEFDSVRREFELHELAVEDAVNAHQRPKLELYGDTLFMVLKTLRFDRQAPDTDVETGEIMVFVDEQFVITVRHGQASGLHEVRLRLEKRPDLLRHGTGAVLHAILDRVVDDYEDVVERVGHDIADVEEEVFSPDEGNPAERIYHLEREVLQFHRAVAPLVVPVERLAKGSIELVADDLRDYFRDVHDHLLRVQQEIAGYRDLLGSVLQANLAQLSVRQNDHMRQISAWVAILAVPTLVAGLYGMNFNYIPGLSWHYGYFLVNLFVIGACGTLYWRFRRSGWL